MVDYQLPAPRSRSWAGLPTGKTDKFKNMFNLIGRIIEESRHFGGDCGDGRVYV